MTRVVRLPKPTEAGEQAALFGWVLQWRGQYSDLGSVCHPANEGKRAPWKAAAMGISAGVPDVICFAPGRLGRGLALELKAGTNKPTPAQLAWIARLQAYGWWAEVVTFRAPGDWHLAAARIAEHLGMPASTLPRT